MTDRPWLRAYPPGVPAEIDPDRYPSLCDLLDSSFARYAAAPAFSNLGATLSFADIDRLSRAFAAYLQSLPGVEKGERVCRADDRRRGRFFEQRLWAHRRAIVGRDA